MGGHDWVKARGPEGAVEEEIASTEEIKAAMQRIAENDMLSRDEYAREVVVAGGKVERGDQTVVVDLESFLEARIHELEMRKMEQVQPAAVWAARLEAEESRGSVH